MWLCPRSRLSSDQLLLLPIPGGSSLLASLYLPEELRAASGRSQPPSLYPERLVHVHIEGGGYRWRLWAGASASLLGAGGERRDPYAKLRADFPSCFAGEAAAAATAAAA